jgi:putative membrane protein
MTSPLPDLIAGLNGVSLFFLLAGFLAVKRRNLELHKRFMLGATLSSTLFLAVYLVHHYQVGSVPYPHYDWTRTIYFAILIPHIILAALMAPFVILTLRHALKNELEKHRKLARYLFPVWVYVSVTGLIVYFMLYRLA